MCQFTPGKVLALGKTKDLTRFESGNFPLPGEWRLTPLVSEGGELRERESGLQEMSIGILYTEPGLELYALSKLSAALAPHIQKGTAIADLDHRLPMGAGGNARGVDTPFGPYAEAMFTGIRRTMRSLAQMEQPRTVAILDSGLDPRVRLQRRTTHWDYARGGGLSLGAPPMDPIGHGSRVARIMDQLLPPTTEFAIGRLPAASDELTVETISRAYADIVVKAAPEVVNLSVSMRGDAYRCPHCGHLVEPRTFLNSWLPLVARMAHRGASGTVTVVAAGNSRQIPASRWLNNASDPLLIAVALDRNGRRAGYSSAPTGYDAEQLSVGAFGGDGRELVNGEGMFTDGDHGTSYAAPIVSAWVVAAKAHARANGNPATLPGIAEQVRSIMPRRPHWMN